MAIKTVNTKKLDMTLGPLIFAGFDDDIVEIKYPDDAWDVVRGADGEVSRANKCVDDLEITVTLKQTSDTNTKLSAVFMADKITGAGVLPFALNDRAGATTVFADSAFISKSADVTYGNSVKSRTWTIRTGPAVMVIGGN